MGRSRRSAPCDRLVKKPPSANSALGRFLTDAHVAIATARSRWNASASRAVGARDVEGARAAVLEARQACVLGEDFGRRPIGESVAVAQPSRDLAQHPPVGPRIARQRQERALTRDAPLGVGDCAVLLAPRRGRQAHMRPADGIVDRYVLRHHQQLQPAQRLAHGIRARQADRPDWCPSPTAP